MAKFRNMSAETARKKAFIVADGFAFVRRTNDEIPYLYVCDLQNPQLRALFYYDTNRQILQLLDSNFPADFPRTNELHIYITEGKRFMIQGVTGNAVY